MRKHQSKRTTRRRKQRAGAEDPSIYVNDVAQALLRLTAASGRLQTATDWLISANELRILEDGDPKKSVFRHHIVELFNRIRKGDVAAPLLEVEDALNELNTLLLNDKLPTAIPST